MTKHAAVVVMLLLRDVATLTVLFLASQKAENDFQVAFLLLAALGYRRLASQGQMKPEGEDATRVYGYALVIDAVADIVLGVALLVVVLR